MRRIFWKRFSAIGLTLLLLAALVSGCGSGTSPSAQTNAPVAQTPASASAPDKSAILKQAAVDYFTNIPDSYFLIDGPGLKAKLDQPGKIYLADIRQAKDYAAGHIPGAINIPFQDLGKKFDTLPKDKQIVIYCYSGQSAGMALSLMKVNGLDALSLMNGYPEWADKNKFPVEK